MAWYNWSQTASSNASADASINWAEGQAPSSINDSARAMMAATAKYRDDIAGAIVTAGSSTAYTVSSYSVFDTFAHLNGQVIAFSPHATSGATVTLNVDSLGAKPLRSSPGVELPAGAMILGKPQTAIYNNANGEFYLQSYRPLAAGEVSTAAVAANAVTYAKLQTASADTILGNPTGSGAAVEEITLGGGLSFTGTTLQVTAPLPATIGGTGVVSPTAKTIPVNQGASAQTTVALTAAQVLSADGTGNPAAVGHQTFASSAKAWVNFSGSGSNGAQTIHDSFNVASVVRTNTGIYTVNFTTPFSSAFYAIGGMVYVSGVSALFYADTAPLAGSFTAKFISITGSLTDPTQSSVICFGSQ